VSLPLFVVTFDHVSSKCSEQKEQTRRNVLKKITDSYMVANDLIWPTDYRLPALYIIRSGYFFFFAIKTRDFE